MLKHSSLNSQKPYQNLGTHCDCLVLEFYHHWKADCKKNADALSFLAVLQFAQKECGSSFPPHFPQNTSSMETGQFQIFLRSMLQVTHSRQIREKPWEPFMMSMFKMQRTVMFLENLQCSAKERVKGRGEISFKLKTKFTSRKCRVTAERLPQQLRFTDFKLGALRSRLLG